MCDLDEILLALADGRRRRVLHCLQEHHAVALPDLAELLAESEREEDVSDIPGEQVRDVYFSLYHTHVPKLESADLVDYEQEADVVVRSERIHSALGRVLDGVSTLLRVE